jgi:hypothetical protein
VRFVQPVVLVLGSVMYLGIIAWVSFIPDQSSESGSPDPTWILVTVGLWNLFLLAATIIAIVDSVLRVRRRETRALALDAMVLKLVSIPFFLVNFLVLVVAFNASIVLIFMGPFLWVIIAIGIGLTYLTMLSTSIPVWATITQLRRERLIGTGLTVLYAILSLVFVTDIAAGILLFGHSRRRPRLAAVWLFLGTGIAMIVVGGLDYFYPFLDAAFPELSYYNIDWLDWSVPIALGLVVILITGIVSLIRLKPLRLEAQRARATRDAAPVSTPAITDAPNGQLAG